MKSKFKSKKTRRGWGKGNKSLNFSLFGNNANGIKAKKDSLINTLKNFNVPSCVLLQETKLRFPGTFKIPGYQIFEKTRTGMGGGLLTAVQEHLSPVLISSGSDEAEILVVQILVGRQKVRIFNGYGPQENDTRDKIYSFWQEFEKEIIDAKEENCLIIAELDANAKLGRDILKNDPNPISENGKMLLKMIQRQNLTCLNGHELCEGSITRQRKTINGVEKSILDFVIICEQLLPHFRRMLVDENRENTLTKFCSLKGARVKSESDHNPIYVEFNLTYRRCSAEKRREIFDFKNESSQKIFYEITHTCQKLRACFNGNKSPEDATNDFFKTLHQTFYKAFSKIRIKSQKSLSMTKNSKYMLMKTELENVLKSKVPKEQIEAAKCKLKEVELNIFKEIADKNAKIVIDQVSKLDTFDGKFNQLGMWKIKSKIMPRPRDPPTAKRDEFCNLITAPSALKNLYLKTYQNRLEHRKIKERYEELRKLKSELWDLRFENLKMKQSVPWSLADLEKATKSLKNNQSRDPNSMINELFKAGIAGGDLKTAVLGLMNLVQSTLFIPDYMQYADITSIFKNKNSRMSLENDRGIFILGVLRKILDKLIYLDKYQHLEKNMSDSNIGARKDKNVRNHLFIVYGIITSVLRGGRGCVDLQIYDLVQAFDALWIQDCMNDLFDCLPENQRDKKLALIYQANVTNLVAVNTPVGQTERVDMPQIVQQGGGWGPMQCSISIDKIGRLCTRRKEHLYKYKDKVDIVALAMVDDLLGIAPCGFESIALNTFINAHIEMKKLKFHTPGPDGRTKCRKIHIGKDDICCSTLLVHGTEMPAVKSESYLGDVISGDGTNKRNIENRVAKGLGKVAQIMSILGKISLGKHYFKIALVLRESLFLSSILTNAEVWYRVTQSDLEELESLDRSLLKRILSCPNSTPTSALYLETGCIRISTIIRARRVNYLHYLLKLPKKDMLSKFFYCQWADKNSHDWTEQVKNDLIELKLTTCLETIENMSVFSWKNQVKKKIKEYEFKKLIEIKNLKNKSKMKTLTYEKLEIQEYLLDSEVREAKAIFSFRVKMARFEGNFKGKAPPAPCPLCFTHTDLQELCFSCPVVKERIECNENYEEIFKQKVSKPMGQTLLAISRLRNDMTKSR